MDYAKVLDVLTSLPVSHAILPHVAWFATSRPANHAICSYIDLSGYASGPIRRCLFIDYIIMGFYCLHIIEGYLLHKSFKRTTHESLILSSSNHSNFLGPIKISSDSNESAMEFHMFQE